MNLVERPAGHKIEVENIPGLERCRIVILEGEIGSPAAHGFADRLESTIAGGVKALLLDMSLLTFMGSSALAALLTLEDDMQGGFVGIVGLQPKTRVVMNNLGIIGLFHLFDSREEATEAVRQFLGLATPPERPGVPV